MFFQLFCCDTNYGTDIGYGKKRKRQLSIGIIPFLPCPVFLPGMIKDAFVHFYENQTSSAETDSYLFHHQTKSYIASDAFHAEHHMERSTRSIAVGRRLLFYVFRFVGCFVGCWLSIQQKDVLFAYKGCLEDGHAPGSGGAEHVGMLRQHRQPRTIVTGRIRALNEQRDGRLPGVYHLAEGHGIAFHQFQLILDDTARDGWKEWISFKSHNVVVDAESFNILAETVEDVLLQPLLEGNNLVGTQLIGSVHQELVEILVF